MLKLLSVFVVLAVLGAPIMAAASDSYWYEGKINSLESKLYALEEAEREREAAAFQEELAKQRKEEEIRKGVWKNYHAAGEDAGNSDSDFADDGPARW